MRSYPAALVAASSLALSGWLLAVPSQAQAKKAPARPAAKPAAKPAAGAKTAAPGAPASEAAATAAIEKLGGRVAPLAQNDNHLEVSYHLLGAQVTDAALVPVK